MDQQRTALGRIIERRIIAVLRLDSPALALQAVDAMAAAGIGVVEVTLTTPGAIELIRTLAGRSDLIVGAGTVLEERQAEEAFAAGARFFASPIFDHRIVAMAREASAVAMPGALTPGEIVAAWRGGADLIKVFPTPPDGAAYLRALRGPLPQIPLAPSGGVSASTAAAMLDAGAAALNVGTWLTHEKDGSLGTIEAIGARARDLVEAVRAAA